MKKLVFVGFSDKQLRDYSVLKAVQKLDRLNDTLERDLLNLLMNFIYCIRTY